MGRGRSVKASSTLAWLTWIPVVFGILLAGASPQTRVPGLAIWAAGVLIQILAHLILFRRVRPFGFPR
jgi:hypothetical protein